MPDTEERILKAAEKEFLRKGYAAARTTAIAGEAGVTHAMLHYYFRTKENLFARVIGEKLSAVAQSVTIPFSDEDATVEECIAKGVSRHFDFVVANADLPRFMISEVMGNEEMMRQIEDTFRTTAADVIARLQRMIDRGAEKGECRRVDASDLIIDIVSLNIFTVLALPLIRNLMRCRDGGLPDDAGQSDDRILELRKREIINTVLSKLRLN